MTDKINKSLNKTYVVNVRLQKQKCRFGYKIKILFNDKEFDSFNAFSTYKRVYKLPKIVKEDKGERLSNNHKARLYFIDENKVIVKYGKLNFRIEKPIPITWGGDLIKLGLGIHRTFCKKQ